MMKNGNGERVRDNYAFVTLLIFEEFYFLNETLICEIAENDHV